MRAMPNGIIGWPNHIGSHDSTELNGGAAVFEYSTPSGSDSRRVGPVHCLPAGWRSGVRFARGGLVRVGVDIARLSEHSEVWNLRWSLSATAWPAIAADLFCWLRSGVTEAHGMGSLSAEWFAPYGRGRVWN